METVVVVGRMTATTAEIARARRTRVGAQWLRWVLLAAVWLASAAYVAPRMHTGWIPFDEGTLAHGAERVLDGELPHRDFDEVYTGGLDYVHAAAFRAFGVSLGSLRTSLLIAFLLWVPAVYYVASRFGPPLVAAGATLLALALSVPEYPAAMPSWYNLFLATFGVAALLRFVDTERRRWLFVAGLAGGLSILVKVIGLYFVGAAVLFVVFREQGAAAGDDGAVAGGGRRRDRAYSAFVIVSLAIFVVLLLGLIWRRIAAEDVFYFVAPGAALAALLVRRELVLRPASRVGSADRLRALITLLAPLLLGVAIPIALFLVPYVRSGTVGTFLYGVFVAPQRRLNFAGRHPPFLATAVAAIPIVLQLGYVPRLRRWVQSGAGSRVILVAMLAGLLLAAGTYTWAFLALWLATIPLAPLTVLAGAWMLGTERATLPASRQLELFALLAAVALCGLVQFPFFDTTYFCYVAPLVVLAVLAVVTSQRPVPRVDGALVLVFFLAFLLWRSNPQMVWKISGGYAERAARAPLDMDRGGLVVRRTERDEYTRLVAALRSHAVGGYTYATPDCPEVYFLSGLRNPTRSIFEFFDDPEQRTPRILGALQEHDVRVVALNQQPNFSGRIDAALDSALTARYPRSEKIGQFVVRWR
ncbi:MAG TPA: glycosyltransferase family 39 protein [Gemmatimonadaceae bacterium]|nr:glycosyltransferase family 39 protein [Gemmatimonadaceae bacterium]